MSLFVGTTAVHMYAFTCMASCLHHVIDYLARSELLKMCIYIIILHIMQFICNSWQIYVYNRSIKLYRSSFIIYIYIYNLRYIIIRKNLSVVTVVTFRAESISRDFNGIVTK